MKNLIFDWNNVNQYGAYSGIYVSQPQSYVIVTVNGQLYLVSVAGLELTGMKDITDISSFELNTLIDIIDPKKNIDKNIVLEVESLLRFTDLYKNIDSTIYLNLQSSLEIFEYLKNVNSKANFELISLLEYLYKKDASSFTTISSASGIELVLSKVIDSSIVLELESLLSLDSYKNINMSILLELNSSYDIEKYLKNINSKVKFELEGLFEYFYKKDVYNFVVVESDSDLIIVPRRTGTGFTEFELEAFLNFISTTPFSGILVYGTFRDKLRLKGIYESEKTIIIRVPDFKDNI